MAHLDEPPVTLPEERIRAAHAEGATLLGAAGYPIEPVTVPLAVEAHRWAWRPDRPRAILIAESHVFTSPDDLTLRIRRELLPPDARATPAAFVRIVHCLGYGEPDLLDGTPHVPNPGTRGFWDIFGRLAGTGLLPRGGRTVPWRQRVAWKVATLAALRERELWLLDASFHGLYSPGGDTLPQPLKTRLWRIWWEHYGSWIMREVAAPSAPVWAVSRGVYGTLSGLGATPRGWVYHPAAHISTSIKAPRWRALFDDLGLTGELPPV